MAPRDHEELDVGTGNSWIRFILENTNSYIWVKLIQNTG